MENHMPPHDPTGKKDVIESGISDETTLKLAKEIAIKFIEVGRITPATFPEIFKDIHAAICQTAGKGKV